MTKKSELVVPALKAKMGDNIYYITFLKMSEIADRISLAEDIHKNTTLRELIQRRVTNRSTEISTYLETQSQRFFNAIIVGVYGGSPKWYELELGKSNFFDPDELPDREGVLGILRLDGKERLFAIDGQHRVAGIKEALSRCSVPELIDEEVCTIFISANVTKKSGLQRTRRLFSTLNRYSKPVDMMDIIALDEDDAVAIVTRQLMEEYPLFKDHRISVIKGKSISVNNKECFTNITTLYEVNDIILSNKRGRKWRDYKRFRPSDEELSSIFRQATDFWKQMIRYFTPLAEVQKGTKGTGIAGNYRHRGGGHLLFRTIGLLAMARAIKWGIGTSESQATWIRKFARLPMDLSAEPWVGLLWDDTSNLMITRKENQDTASFLLLYMAGADMTKLKISERRLRERYAGAINRPVEEVKLPVKIT